MLLTDVTDVLAERRQRPEKFGRMLAWSLAVHVGAVALLLFGPFDWQLVADEPPRTVMTISLAGAPGPRAGGMTPMGGKAVPVPTPAKPRAVPPPPPKPRAVPAPTSPVRRPQPQPKPAEEEPEPGVTRTDTGARGQGFGLTTGGAGGSGVQLDVANFCCPEYIEQMVTLVQRNWQSNQGISGSTVVQFTITRGGSIQGVRIERPSGFVALDLAAERALLITRLPELPLQFPNPTLTVHLTFEYRR